MEHIGLGYTSFHEWTAEACGDGDEQILEEDLGLGYNTTEYKI
jgi:hypothetical protein